jgi:hypothetical protein
VTKVIRFFPYYGAKQSRWAKYPAPQHDTIIEPFAGSAAYATHYPDREVILIEKDERVAAVWKWLISVPEDDFMALPTFEDIERVSETDVTGPAAHFMRLWAGQGGLGQDKVSPLTKRLLGIRPLSSWGKPGKERLCSQLRLIRHWSVLAWSYEDAPDVEATWFIDPPYVTGGSLYKVGLSGIDHTALAAWCKGRQGQVIVCEGEGATWLPFRVLPGAVRKPSTGNLGRARTEYIWTNEGETV